MQIVKNLLVVAAATLALTLVACGDKGDDSGGGDSNACNACAE